MIICSGTSMTSITSLVIPTTSLSAHIQVLKTFHLLYAQLSPDCDKSNFALCACQRFEAWLSHEDFAQSINEMGNLYPDKLPPPDVLLVLYTYMLHPLPYLEDTIRLFPQILGLQRFPLDEMASFVNIETAKYEPSASQVLHWTTVTGLPFEYDTSSIRADSSHHKDSIRTDTSGEPQSSAYARLIVEAEDFISSGGSIVGLGGTILDPATGQADLVAAKELSWDVAKLVCDLPRSNHSSDYISEKLYAANKSESWAHRIHGILRAYSQPSIYSIDLALAVQREEQSINSMHKVGFYCSIVSDGEQYSRAVSRYTDFLLLAMSGKFTVIQPSLDVDFVWHTHQLNCVAYRKDTLDLLGATPDHDPSIPAGKFDNYNAIIHGWEAREGKPYPISWGKCNTCSVEPCDCHSDDTNCGAPPLLVR